MPHKLLVLTAALCLLSLLAVPIACAPGTSLTKHIQSYKPDGTRIVEKTTVRTNGEEGRAEIGPAGASVRWDAKAINYAKANLWIFYAAAAVLITAGIVCFIWLGQRVLGLALAAAGGALAFVPSLIDVLGWPVAAAAGVLLLFGLVWAVAKYCFRVELVTRGQAAVAKLTREGKAAEATAVQRAIDPALDQAFRERKAAT